MNKYFLVSLIFLAHVVIVKGQTTTQPDVIPPSPEAASLGKYGQFPVSYNTGTPQIDIPLHTIVVNDMQLPISLSYHAGGIKVSEIASSVGLGWSLNAGGAITRVMRSRPDESSNGYFNRSQWDTWQTMKTWVTGPPVPGVNDQASQKYEFQLKVSQGEKDLQPDIFYFNFAGYTGRIYFDIDKKPVIVPFQDLKIDHPFSVGKTEWVISTPEGLEFVFKNSDAELTTPLGTGSYSPPFYSTWYLSQIRSVKQPGFIQFNYTNLTLAGIESTPNPGIILTRKPVNLTCTLDPAYPTEMGSSEYSISTKYLNDIQFPDGSIAFSSTNDREDYYNSVTYNGRKLNGMAVISGKTPNVKNVKNFQFTYDYSGSGTAKRLRLLKVQEIGKNPYTFQYNSNNLPAPTSFSQDYWGYFNGKPNSSLIPALTTSEAASFNTHPLANANRSPDATLTKANMLEKITYPTMGYTRFNFEAHTSYGTEFIMGGTSTSAQGAIANTNMNSYESGLMNYYQTQQTAYLGGPINIKSSSFTLSTRQEVVFSTDKAIWGGGSIGNIAETLVYKGTLIDYNASPICHDCSGKKLLDAGTYIMFAAASQANVIVSLEVSYPLSVIQNNTVGGVRIASIENFDGTKTYRKNFKYHGAFDKSYGVLFSPPKNKLRTPCGNLYASAYDLMPAYEGSHIGYKQVEVVDETGENGKTVYVYNNSIHDFLRNLLDDEIYLKTNGDTIKRTSYRYNGNYEQCLSSGTRCPFASTARGIEMNARKRLIEKNGIYIVSDYLEFDILERSYNTFFVYQSEIIEKTFNQDSNTDFLLSKKNISRGKEVIESYNQSHTLPTQIIQTQTSGERIIEKIYNSPEETGGSMAVKVPIRNISIREINGQQFLTTAQYFQYQNNLLSRIDNYEASAPQVYSEGMALTYVPKLHQTYNASKKLVERFPPGGVRTGFVWDTYNQRPIAEVQNSAGGIIAFTSFENSSDEGNWSFALNAVNGGKAGEKCHAFVSAQNITRGTLVSTTSYKVSYWAKNGVPTVTNVTASNDAPGPDAQGWTYYEKTVSGTTAITISSAAGTLIDELRLHPANARMKSLTYKPLIGISTLNDFNNQIQYFEYDAVGRLEFIKDYRGNIIQHHSYKFKN
jgi:hypothetical protein